MTMTNERHDDLRALAAEWDALSGSAKALLQSDAADIATALADGAGDLLATIDSLQAENAALRETLAARVEVGGEIIDILQARLEAQHGNWVAAMTPAEFSVWDHWLHLDLYALGDNDDGSE